MVSGAKSDSIIDASFINIHYNIYSYIYIYGYNTIRMYSGITSGRVLNGELLYTKILEVNLFAFAYRNLYETVCRQMQTN